MDLPRPKPTMDPQLALAICENRWDNVVRLASELAKSLKDPYYEDIRVCADLELESTPAKAVAVLDALDRLDRARDVPDLYNIELFEWSYRRRLSYVGRAKTLGSLGARWVRANPRDPNAVHFLKSCLERWDLVNAQQIAATLDKAFVGDVERRFAFLNITLTFLLSTSPQCPEARRKIFSTLALRRLQQAADIVEKPDTLETSKRGLTMPEEISLYHKVMLAHGTREDFLKQMLGRKTGVLTDMNACNKLLFHQALDVLEAWGEWDQLFRLCRGALNLKNAKSRPLFTWCDCKTWRKFTAAASRAANPETALQEVQTVLGSFVKIHATAPMMYKKNISLAVLEVAFAIPPATISGDDMARPYQLGRYLDKWFEKPSAFDDVKGFVAQLDFEEIQFLLQEILPKLLSQEDSVTIKGMILKSLTYKLQYFLSTCPQTLAAQSSTVDGEHQDRPYLCRFTLKPTDGPSEPLLKQIIVNAAKTYKQITQDHDLSQAAAKADKDPRIDLTMVIGHAFLKLAGLQRRAKFVAPFMQVVEPALFLQAVLVLDTQLGKTPADVGLRLLLIRLYLLLGCASYAHSLWKPLGVKRAIQDALSPLFFDRLSTISPALFGPQQLSPPLASSEPQHGFLADPLVHYYSNSLRREGPVRIQDAAVFGKYHSLLGLVEFDKRLRMSSTLVMALVEERCALRMLIGNLKGVPLDSTGLLPSLITDDHEFVNVIDYGAFTNLESSYGPHIHQLTQLGPELSNHRSHLALLCEQARDMMEVAVPDAYTPKDIEQAVSMDMTYKMETFQRLQSSMTSFLHDSSAGGSPFLTYAEASFYTVVSQLLAMLILTYVIESDRPGIASLAASAGEQVATTLLDLQDAMTLNDGVSLLGGLGAPVGVDAKTKPSKPRNDPDAFFFTVTEMHTVSQALQAATLARRFLANARKLAIAQEQKDGDQRTKFLAGVERWDGIAAGILDEIRTRVKTLRQEAAGMSWLGRLVKSTVGGGGDEDGAQAAVAPAEPAWGQWNRGVERKDRDELTAVVRDIVGGREGAQTWADKVLWSWRDGLKGWEKAETEVKLP